MPPILALLLCTGFVFFLLRLEARQSPNVSRALWIPTLWMLYIASKPLAVWFAPAGQHAGGDVDAGSPTDRLFLTAILGISLLILASRKFDWLGTLREHRWLALLLGFMLVSTIWSEIPQVSCKRWIRQFQAVVMGFMVLSEASPQEAVQSIFRRTTYITVPFSLLLIKYYPMYGVQYDRWSGYLMWTGVTTQKNGLGRLCLISGFFLIWALVTRWRRGERGVSKVQTYAEWFLLAQILVLLKGPSGVAASATSIVVLIAGAIALGGLIWINRREGRVNCNAVIASIAIIIGVGILTPLVGGATVGAFTGSLGRDTTLTGRTDIWAALLPNAMQNLILGAGFGGFWTDKTVNLYLVNEAHNGYLDVLLELGVIGLLLHSAFLLSCCYKARRAFAFDFDAASLCLCFVLMAVLHNVSESSMHIFACQLTAIVIFLVLALPGSYGVRSQDTQSANAENADMSENLTNSLPEDSQKLTTAKNVSY
jgi:exopolysaccharide production protein ExoQ